MSSRYAPPRTSWRTPLLAALALLLSPTAAAQSADALAQQATGTQQGASVYRGGLETLLDQLDPASTSGLISQVNATTSDFDAESADDFVVPAGLTWTVEEVEVLGFYSASEGFTPGPAEFARVTFYANDDGEPGDQIAQQDVPASDFTDNAGDFVIPIDAQTFESGTYWIVVQAIGDNLDFITEPPQIRRWNLILTSDGSGGENPGHLRNEGGAFGIGPDWTPFTALDLAPNISFALRGSSQGEELPDAITFMPDTVRASAMTGMATSASVTLMNNSDEAVDFSVVGFDEDEDARLSDEALRTIENAPARRSYNWPALELGKYDADPRQGDGVRYGAGGPDAFGYTWIDSNEPGGPEYDFVDISGTGTELAFSSADDGSASITLPFEFSFYGDAKTTALVSTNGYLTFGSAGTDFSNDPIPSSATPNDLIAPFWDDLDVDPVSNPGAAAYAQDLGDGRFVVQWENMRLADPDGPTTLSYQVILSADGTIVFQYRMLDTAVLNSATVGIENADGTTGVEVAFNEPYLEEGLAILITNVPQFVSDVDPSSGTIPAGGSVTLDIDFEAQIAGGTYEAVLSVDTDANDLAIPLVYTVTGTPVLELSGDLDLGTITQGFPSTATLTLFNTGDDVLTVTEITSSDDAFEVDFDDDDLEIAAGDSATVTVTFDPDGAGDFAGTLTVVSDGGTVTVNLSGTADSAGDIAVAPDTVRATLEAGETGSASFTITNEGVGDLIFTIPGFEEDADRVAQMRARYEAQMGREAAPYADQKGNVDRRTSGLASFLRAGGPDAFGYTFVDSDETGGPVYNFEDISGMGTALGLGDDEGSGAIDLPFSFPFYGESYDEAYVNSNGWISFVDPGAASSGVASRTNTMLPDPAVPNALIAVLWDDLIPAGDGVSDVFVQDMADGRFIVQWNEVPRFFQPAPLTFQAILTSSGQILLQYETIDLTGVTATAGIENADGTDGLEASFNEEDYLQDGLAIRFGNTPPFVTDVDPDSGTLGPDESVEVTLSLSAEDLFAGVYLADLLIESNDADETPLALPIELTVTGQPLIVTDAVADSLDFGTVVAGEDSVLTLTISNDGTDVLTFDPAITKGIGQNNAFSFDTEDVEDVGPGESFELQIRFAPDEAGSFSATLVLQSNDDDTGTVEVALVGEAIEAALPSVSADDVDIEVVRGMTETTEITVSNDAAAGADALSFTVSVVQTGDPAQPGTPDARWLIEPLAPYSGSASGPSAREQGTASAGGEAQAVRLGDLVADGSFEAGTPNPVWEEGSTNFGTPLCTSADCAPNNEDFQPNSGTWWVWFGGIPQAEEGFIEQDVTIPSGSAELSYFLRIPAIEGLGSGTLRVLMDGDILATYTEADVTTFGDEYVLVTLDASEYADGGTHTLRFESENLAGNTINFFVDDVSIVSTGPAILSVSPMMATLEPGEEITLTLTANGVDVPVGVYEFDVIIDTNVPGAAPLVVDVTVDVQFNIANEEMEAPVEFTLRPAFPNPVAGSGTVRYGLPTPSAVQVRLYDVTGRLVSTLVDAEKTSGWHNVTIDAGQLAPGVYVVAIRAGSFSDTQKLTIVR